MEQANRSPLSRIACALVACVTVACSSGVRHHAAFGAGDMSSARLFDHEGVIAYEAGHYAEAIRYFDAALSHGGPPSERWNIARCLLKLDDPERADQALAAYLALPGLSPQDRRDAVSTLDEVRARPSTLTVVSAPSGSTVLVDGRRQGNTPLAVMIAPGQHVVTIERAGGSRDEQHVDARFGRPVIVEVPPP